MTNDLPLLTEVLFGLAILLFILEEFGVHLFIRFFYAHGARLFHEVVHLPRPRFSNLPSKVIKRELGKFKFITPHECLFTQQYNNFRLNTAFFSLTGMAVWNSQGVEISGRLRPGTVLFWIVIMAVWVSGLIPEIDPAFRLLMIIISGFWILISAWIEKRRIVKMVKELKTILQNQ